jgi:hypothetical protein
MTDPVPAPGASTKPSASSTQEAMISTLPIAPKKPGLLRKAAFIILGVVILAFAVVLPWWIDRMVLNGIKSGLANRGLELDAKSDLSFSIIRTRLSGANLIVREQGKPDAAPVFTADRLEAKLALLDSVSSADVIIDELALEGAAGDLRRRKDGTSPVETKEPGASGSTDWVGMAKKGMEYLKKRQEEQKQKEEGKTEPTPPKEKKSKPAYDWTGANRYEPSPVPGKPMHIPRVLVRKLSVTGKAIALPDKTPFDVAGFSITGTNVASKLIGNEVMNLNGAATTVGAGPLKLAIERTAAGNGKLGITAEQVPLEAIADRNVSGDALSHYGPTGTAAMTVNTTWTGWDLVGAIESRIQKLALNPDRESGDRARQVAQVVNNLKDQTVVWPVKLGGTLFAPTITDNGVETVIKTAGTDAVKNAAMQKGEEELNKAVGDKLKDQPAAQDAVNKAKDLLKGWGK